MIISHLPDVNPDLYCYETSLSIPPCEQFLYNLLDKINKESEEILVFRKRYVDPRLDKKSVAKLLGNYDDARILLRRRRQYDDRFPTDTQINFRQYFMPEDMEKEFKELIPQWIKDIGEFSVGVQISRDGTLLAPHKGHQRQSSLFFLLQENDEHTKWYRSTGEFKIFDFFRIPDLDKIENIVEAKILPGKWTLFNHAAWHSVHKHGTGDKPRININIDFDYVSMAELVQKVKEHERNA